MKRILLSVAALGFSLSAHAADTIAKVESLKCRATNGVVIESVPNTPFVATSWFGLSQTFQLMDRPVISQANYVRIPLGLKGAPTSYLYDIFLWGTPNAGELNTLDGVIGQTIYGTFIPPFVPSPTSLPLGFRPIAGIRCELVGF